MAHEKELFKRLKISSRVPIRMGDRRKTQIKGIGTIEAHYNPSNTKVFNDVYVFKIKS